jgi:hypothetical protein
MNVVIQGGKYVSGGNQSLSYCRVCTVVQVYTVEKVKSGLTKEGNLVCTVEGSCILYIWYQVPSRLIQG